MIRFLLLALLGPCLVLAQERAEMYGPRPKRVDTAREWYETQRAELRDDPDKLVLPGLIADRAARRVEVLAEATGLKAEEVIEFLMVDQQSAHGYEALLWSYAKPSDVHRALEFIGLKPGAPTDPVAGRLWSVGDPVAVTVKTDGDDEAPIEHLILDTQTGEALPVEGFVFAGSLKLPADDDHPARYAVDVSEPRSIISIYNEPAVVLDVPRQVAQGDVYGQQVVNPEAMLPEGQLVTVVMRPGALPEYRRGPQVRLAVEPGESPSGLRFRLTDANGVVLKESEDLTPVLENLVSLKQGNAAPYLSLDFASSVAVADVNKTCVLLATLEGVVGAMRVNPPTAGQLYYRAFVPPKELRRAEDRWVQPWELHLKRDANHVAAELVWHERVRGGEVDEPAFKRHAYPVANSAEMQTRIDDAAREQQRQHRLALPPLLLVHTGGEVTYGQVLAFVRPLLAKQYTVYVLTEEK